MFARSKCVDTTVVFLCMALPRRRTASDYELTTESCSTTNEPASTTAQYQLIRLQNSCAGASTTARAVGMVRTGGEPCTQSHSHTNNKGSSTSSTTDHTAAAATAATANSTSTVILFGIDQRAWNNNAHAFD